MMGRTDLHELRQSIRKESRAREKAAAAADAGRGADKRPQAGRPHAD